MARLTQILAPDATTQFAIVHGPPGVGKSAVLRRFATVATDAGWSVVVTDPDRVGTDEVVASSTGTTVVVIDDADTGQTAVRDAARRLPQRVRYVLAMRRAPDDAWTDATYGWRTLVEPLGPLDDREVGEVLAAHGVPPGRDADALADWASGNLLAMILGARAVVAGDWIAGTDEIPQSLAQRLADVMLGPPAGVERPAVLTLAALTREVTADLLRSCLQSTDVDGDLDWLASLTCTDVSPTGASLPELLREALALEVSRTEPALDRELRCRLADVFHARGVQGHPRVAADLADLARDPGTRTVLGAARDRQRIDIVRPGDAATVEAHRHRHGEAAAWELAERWWREAPSTVRVLREHGAVRGYVIAAPPDGVPEWAADEPVAGPWVRHAAELPGGCMIWREVVDVAGLAGAPPCVAQLNLAGFVASGVPNPRWGIIGETHGNTAARVMCETFGGRREPALDAVVGSVVTRCWVVDFGAGGLLGALRDRIYRDVGVVPQSAVSHPVPVAVDAVMIREALSAFHEPLALARSPLAAGRTPDARAEYVRALLSDALAETFVRGTRDVLIRDALEQSFVSPHAKRSDVAQGLGVSRTTLFRLVGEGCERLAAYLNHMHAGESANDHG